jgi:hypothetical protein
MGKGAWWIAVEMHKAERAGDTKKYAAPQSGSERAASGRLFCLDRWWKAKLLLC